MFRNFLYCNCLLSSLLLYKFITFKRSSHFALNIVKTGLVKQLLPIIHWTTKEHPQCTCISFHKHFVNVSKVFTDSHCALIMKFPVLFYLTTTTTETSFNYSTLLLVN